MNLEMGGRGKKARKRAKAGGGQLLWSGKGWSARYWAIVDGERIRRCVALGTENRAVAAAKLARLAVGEADATSARDAETFEQAARRLVPVSIKTWRDRMARLETDAFPKIGTMAVTAVRPSHIRAALESAVDRGLSRTTCSHLLVDISTVLGELWRDEVIAENPAKRVRVPKGAAVDTRPRVVLMDDEFAHFMACAEVSPELHVVALVSRCLGGMRTSDLHAWSWSNVDTVGWQWADVPRPKTASLDRLALPDVLVGPLQSWWHAHGSPMEGSVFPARRGDRAGQVKLPKTSYAARLRTALWEAGVRRGETRETCELQTDTDRTRRCDFHSFRRAYATGLARAAVNVQTAMRLAGHRTAGVHQRYVRLTEALAAPASAMPTLWASHLPSLNRAISATPRINVGNPTSAPLERRRCGPIEEFRADVSQPFSASSVDGYDLGKAGTRTTCPSGLPPLGARKPLLDAGLADAVLGMALRGLADRAALTRRGSLLAGGAS